MFQFPGCPPHGLWIHPWVTGHCPRRVPPFGYPRIEACLRLPVAFRSLPRPSSAVGALASTLCPYSLDLLRFAAYDPPVSPGCPVPRAHHARLGLRKPIVDKVSDPRFFSSFRFTLSLQS